MNVGAIEPASLVAQWLTVFAALGISTLYAILRANGMPFGKADISGWPG